MNELMKYLIFFFSMKAFAEVCVNRAGATDYGYLYRVIEETPDSYQGEHLIFGVTKTLPKSLGLVKVECPSEEQRQVYSDKIRYFKSKHVH